MGYAVSPRRDRSRKMGRSDHQEQEGRGTPVLAAERARILSGKNGAEAVAERLEQAPARTRHNRSSSIPHPRSFFHQERKRTREADEGVDGRNGCVDERLTAGPGATAPHGKHVALLPRAAGRADILRALLRHTERGLDFL